MATEVQAVKMVPVVAGFFEAIGYMLKSRQLYIKFRSSPTLCFDNVPAFRYEGLLKAPRRNASYRTFIKDRFLTKSLELPIQA